jgi:PHD/YefM family antitoxin component YafN of YafNO toxin-antitoxin module
MNFKTKALLTASSLFTKANTDSVRTVISENWKEIVIVIAAAYIMEDLDTVAEMAETSAAVDVLTAASEGVI